MTRGLAILCMLTLHLFCKQGSDILGTPLLWINEDTPLVYFFGFFAEICVPIYTICAGYARYLMLENGNDKFKNRLTRTFNLLKNYWIVLVLFCALGLIFNCEIIPESPSAFLKSIFLLHSYNGAWWYLNTYIILLLIPTSLLFFPVQKIKKPFFSFFLFLSFDVVYYILTRFGIIPDIDKNTSVISFIFVEIFNLISVLSCFWLGALFCKYNTLDKIKGLLDKYLLEKYHSLFLGGILIFVFIFNSIFRKAIFIPTIAVVTFVIFNLLKKPIIVEKIFTFLGKHSTNIWLTHMFFYENLFVGLVTLVKYPLLMLLFIVLLCTVTSYVVMAIQTLLNSITNKLKNCLNVKKV